MKILLCSINFSPEPTGIGKYSGEMAAWFSGRGHDVRVVTSPPHYPHWKVYSGYSSWRFRRETLKGKLSSSRPVKVLRCPLWVPRAPRHWQRVVHLLSFSLSSGPAIMMQALWKPDVVVLVAPTLFCSPQVLCAAHLSGAITWIHVQDFELDAAFDLKDFSSTVLRRVSEKMERALMRRFDRGSTISKNMLQRLVAKGVDSQRSVYVPNWVDTSVIFPMEKKSALRRELGIADDKVVTLYSGTMGKKQGIETLVEVSQRMAQEPHLQFVFCGDGPAQPALRKATRQASNVICLPLQPSGRLNELLNLADIHLLPQLANAADLMMPSKLIGMMASGRAVLATAAPGTEISAVLSGRGILVPPGDIDAFASALLALANNPDLRKELGDKAREYAVEHFEKDKVLATFEAAMRDALAPPLLESNIDRVQSPSEDQFQTEPVVLASHAADD